MSNTLMLTLVQVESVLRDHGISSIEDMSTGSSLEDDLGLKALYQAPEVFEWLGY